MKKIKIWLGWFTANDAGKISESYSGLQPALKSIVTAAGTGKRECFVKNLTPKDVLKLEKLEYEVKHHSEEWNYGIKTEKYLIKW